MELDLNLRVRVSELQGKLTEQVCFSPILCKRVSPDMRQGCYFQLRTQAVASGSCSSRAHNSRSRTCAPSASWSSAAAHLSISCVYSILHDRGR